MEIISAQDLSFKYGSANESVLKNINLSVSSGEFILICGKSGCGKTTLLRSFKPCIAPVGSYDGKVVLNGITDRDIGFVFQNPEEQIVCDRVFSEMAFGLENAGMEPSKIRKKIAEISAFFGMGGWFGKKTFELSGGQKQLLNLASVMALQPQILLLDEPLSQLDPISSGKFVSMLERINKELGTTVIIAEHTLDDLLTFADRVCVMDGGEMIFNGTPDQTVRFLFESKCRMSAALPDSVVIGGALNEKMLPLTVKDCRAALNGRNGEFIDDRKNTSEKNIALRAQGVSFAYSKKEGYVIDDLDIEAYKGELLAVLGENGSGKSTLLKLLAGVKHPLKGKVKRFVDRAAYLPQETLYTFVEDIFEDDLELMKKSLQKTVYPNFDFFKCIDSLMTKNTLDMSGGEQQKAALYKLLMTDPQILLLDEPTKGIDAFAKTQLARLLNELKKSGVCIVVVTHDTEFAARYADRCAMMFSGDMVSVGDKRQFFCENTFFTTHARRISCSIIENAITSEEVISVAVKN